MNRNKRIVVSQRVEHLPGIGETRDGLDQRLINWIYAVGGLPIPVPNVLDNKLAGWLKAIKPDAIVLSGGNDIGSSLDRDFTEGVLLEHAEVFNLPVLGICRGMQMLSHHNGVALDPIDSHARTYHSLEGEAVSRGELPARVKSFHNYGLFVRPPDYVVLASALDGSIEAMRHTQYRWEGWMWHPERDSSNSIIEISKARSLLLKEEK